MEAWGSCLGWEHIVDCYTSATGGYRVPEDTEASCLECSHAQLGPMGLFLGLVLSYFLLL